MEIKRGFYYSRVCLPLWLLLLAVWTVFNPKVGIKVLESYVKSKRKADSQHK